MKPGTLHIFHVVIIVRASGRQYVMPVQARDGEDAGTRALAKIIAMGAAPADFEASGGVDFIPFGPAERALARYN